MNIYVTNIPWATKEADLRRLFEPHGNVVSVKIICDRETGRSRGFGFVEMEGVAAGERAIRALDGDDSLGRELSVRVAEERTNNNRGGGR